MRGSVVAAALAAAMMVAAGDAQAAALGPAGPEVIATVAGGVGGPAKATSVAVNPAGVAFGGGSLYVADFCDFSAAVRKVSPATGQLTTAAGTGAAEPVGDGGPATNAAVGPRGVAVDAAGNLLVADASHDRVRVVAAATGTFYGQAMTAGDIYTVAGTGAAGFAGDGGPAPRAELNNPAGVAVDAAGNLHELRHRRKRPPCSPKCAPKAPASREENQVKAP